MRNTCSDIPCKIRFGVQAKNIIFYDHRLKVLIMLVIIVAHNSLFNTVMYKVLQWTCVFIIILYNCHGQLMPSDVKFYEYGEHAEGEQISYMYYGLIPGFKPIYKLNNVTPTKEELEPVFTYLRVEYYNLISDVKISYDPNLTALNFHVKFPFVDTPIAILGYSLPTQVNQN